MDRAKLVSDLARVGSIEGLLAQDPTLTPETVAGVLDHAALLLAEEDRPRQPISPLYRAYNGFMLGLFTAAAFVFDLRQETQRHETVIHRISEFLLEFTHEFGTVIDLEDADNFEDAVDGQLRALDDEIADFYQLGLATFRRVVLHAGEDPIRNEAAEDEAQAEQILHRLGHPPVLLRSVLDDSARTDREEEPTWQDMITNCIRLVRDIVAGLPEEPDTCFVALPFRTPYEERYLNFYRGAARRMAQRSIRAWGGVGDEEHQELLLALIAKSGALLADVTEPNANVALEVGFALGQNKMVYLVADQDVWKNAANIQLDWVFPYRTTSGEVRPGEEERAGLYFTALKALRRPGPIPAWTGKPILVLQAINEIRQQPDQEARS
jgi:hypothetical protein